MGQLRGTLAEVGEFALVNALTQRFASGADDRVVVGPGDDAAVVEVGGGQVVASLDMLVQGRHFRLDWSSATDIGHKAAAENLSDINAMGGRPTSLLIGLGAPPDLDVAWAMEFADGLAEETALVGASIVGGDLTQADAITISIAVLGECEHGVVRRSGGQPGDVVALAGRQGWADAGFAVLGRGFRSPRVVVEAHRRPELRGRFLRSSERGGSTRGRSPSIGARRRGSSDRRRPGARARTSSPAAAAIAGRTT